VGSEVGELSSRSSAQARVATVVSGSETGLTDQLGELAESQDEVLVTLQPTADSPARRRDEEDVLFRAIANATHAIGGLPR
jgi:hypothetical protein